MSIVVKSNKALDSALNLLQREISRERILQTYNDQRYRTKQSDVNHELRRKYKKTKRWKRKIRKLMHNRGHF